MKSVLIFIIEAYQKSFSPDHSNWGKLLFPNGYCQYYPSCSEYTKQSIDQFGSLKGFLLGVWRVIRCNPYSKGGIDEVGIARQKKRLFNTNN